MIHSAQLRNIGSNEIDDLCEECGIKSTLQKVKLRTAVQLLLNDHLPPVMIDKEERIALTQMAQKIKDIQNAITLIDDTNKSYHCIFLIYLFIHICTQCILYALRRR